MFYCLIWLQIIRVCHRTDPLQLTARQYGEVVLPDAASGQGLGTLARKLSRCKEGMARVFAVMVLILLSITRVAVQVKSEPVNCHDTGF